MNHFISRMYGTFIRESVLTADFAIKTERSRSRHPSEAASKNRRNAVSFRSLGILGRHGKRALARSDQISRARRSWLGRITLESSVYFVPQPQLRVKAYCRNMEYGHCEGVMMCYAAC